MSIYYDAYYGDSTTKMKSSVDIILSKLSKLELPYDIIFKIEKHVYHWIHSHKQPKIHKEILYSLYKKEFPDSTPVTVACEKGRLDHLKIFVAGHRGSMKKLLEEVGTDSGGLELHALMTAAENEEHAVLIYLIQYGVNTDITSSGGLNALHWSALQNKKSTRCLELLLKNMPLESINKKDWQGQTPLDIAYINGSPIQNDIVELIRQHGGKANWHDANGRNVGRGNGDLND